MSTANRTTETESGTAPEVAGSSSADLMISLIDERAADLVDAVENRRVYDFRLPRGHIGRRRGSRSPSRPSIPA